MQNVFVRAHYIAEFTGKLLIGLRNNGQVLVVLAVLSIVLFFPVSTVLLQSATEADTDFVMFCQPTLFGLTGGVN